MIELMKVERKETSQVSVMRSCARCTRSAHGDVTLHGHAGQVLRAVPAGRHTDRSDSS